MMRRQSDGMRRRPPRHAHVDLIMLLRWSTAVHWTVLGTLAVAGAVFAFLQGIATGSDPAVPPPAVAQGPGWIAPSNIAFVSPLPVATSAAGPAPVSAGPNASIPETKAALGLAADGIPVTALQAYHNAAIREASSRPDCHLPWQLLAAIGRVESDHGRFGHAVLYADGVSVPHIIGPPLDGNGTALIRDTDDGVLDGDTVYDRAVGPMQFIPSTWAAYGVDASGDGKADPFNVYDAAAAAADYLCVAGGDLATGAGQQRAVMSYNHSAAYLHLVMDLEIVYSDGAQLYTPPPSAAPPPQEWTVPPVDPGGRKSAPAPPALPTSTPTESAPPPPTTPTSSSKTSAPPPPPPTTPTTSSTEQTDAPPPPSTAGIDSTDSAAGTSTS
jgi:hypothetical protein